MIEITKACTGAFMKARNSLILQCRENKKKTEMVKMYFLKLLLTDVVVFLVHGQPSIKWTSWKGNDMLLKVEKMYSLLRNVIGKQIKEEGHDRNY